MAQILPNPYDLISSYFNTLVGAIEISVDKQLKSIVNKNPTSENTAKLQDEWSSVFRDKTSAKEYLMSARKCMINYLRFEEIQARERLLVVKKEPSLAKCFERKIQEDEFREIVFSKLFANKSFLILSLDSLQKPFKIVILVLDYFMDHSEKLIFRKHLSETQEGSIFYYQKQEILIKNLESIINSETRLVNFDKKYLRAYLLSEFVNKEIVNSKFIPHVIPLKQSILFGVKEMRIDERIFEFKRVNLDKQIEIFPNLEHLDFAYHSKNPVRIENLSAFVNLRHLFLLNAKLVQTSLQGLVKLQELILSKCSFLNFETKSFLHSANIEELSIMFPLDFDRINFRHLTNLKSLSIDTSVINPPLGFLDHLSDSLDVLIVENMLEETHLHEFLNKIENLNLKALEIVTNATSLDGYLAKTGKSLQHLQIKFWSHKLDIRLKKEFFPRLERLILEANSLRQIVDISQTKIVNLKSLKIVNCTVYTSSYGLSEFRNLDELILNSVVFKKPNLQRPKSQTILAGLNKLTKLNLENNSMTEVDSAAFVHTPNLTQLILANNKLKTLSSDLFKRLSNLRQLDLSRCQIETLQDGVFAHLENLEKLSLNGNPISAFSKLTFEGLESLSELCLSKSLFKRVNKSQAFSSLKSLVRIEFNNE